MSLTAPKPNHFSVSTPIYYVNDLPHIGSAYTTIAADVIARFQRLQGKSVLMITGTDEHGQKIQRTAEALGRSPQAHCDEIAAAFLSLWEKMNIQTDRFIRTTSERHVAIVREFFGRVWDKGDIYIGQQQGWYCVSCEEFKEERELLAGHHCPLHPNKEAEWRDEQNYFFRLSKYQEPLEQLYAANPDFIQPDSRRNEVLSFVSRGLQDFSISRINVEWGIPLPVDPQQTIYVWFDALLNYVTASVALDAEPTLENALANAWPIDLHIIGKDILRLHAISWPAMLMSAEMPIPARLFAHGFLTKDGQKMSKSLGNIIDPVDLVTRYGSDAIRYYFLKEIEFGRDGDFSETRFVNTLNADLANDLGNLLNRTLKLADKNCQGCTPNVQSAEIPIDNLIRSKAESLGEQVTQAYNALAFSVACEAVLAVVRACNRYVGEQAPWSLYKQEKGIEADRVLYTVLESVRLAAYLLSPIVPDLSTSIYQQLGFSVDFNSQESIKTLEFASHSSWGTLPAKQPLGEAVPVFQRLELPTPPT